MCVNMLCVHVGMYMCVCTVHVYNSGRLLCTVMNLSRIISWKLADLLTVMNYNNIVTL